MKHHCKKVTSAILGLFILALGSAFAAHESNNYALLESEDTSADGIAIVNYVAGKESWTATTHVSGLPEGQYYYAVRVNTGGVIGEPQIICDFMTKPNGSGHCSANHFDLGGFHEAVILDVDGNIVLSGFFERRGGNRAK